MDSGVAAASPFCEQLKTRTSLEVKMCDQELSGGSGDQLANQLPELWPLGSPDGSASVEAGERAVSQQLPVRGRQ